MKSDLVNVYTGSDIEANFIASLLIDNQIECNVRNVLEESISAGWASGSTFNSTIIRVDIADVEKAKHIINEYLKDREL